MGSYSIYKDDFISILHTSLASEDVIQKNNYLVILKDNAESDVIVDKYSILKFKQHCITFSKYNGGKYVDKLENYEKCVIGTEYNIKKATAERYYIDIERKRKNKIYNFKKVVLVFAKFVKEKYLHGNVIAKLNGTITRRGRKRKNIDEEINSIDVNA